METSELKKIKIVDFCAENGIELTQDSREYYRLAEHDSCVISDRKNLFKWNSRNLGGDIFNFIQAYYDCSFIEAKEKLLNKEYEIRETDVNYQKEPFVYDKSMEQPINKSKKYLISERRISEELTNDLISKGLICEDKHSNVLFLWKKDEKIVGCTEQGTVARFNPKKQKTRTWKKIQENSEENYGFKITYGKPKSIYFFESEIDMLSYITQKPETAQNATFVSMNGLKKVTVLQAVTDHFKEHKELPESAVICVDNDEAGRTFYDTEFKGKGIGRNGIGTTEIKADIPKKEGFDWNDTLTKGKEIIEGISERDISKLKIFCELKTCSQFSNDYEMSNL